METEELIVYSILEVVNKGIHSDDNKIDERIIRGLLKPYRASVLAKATLNGYLLSDECYQSLGALKYTRTTGRNFATKLPKTIRFQDNFGAYLRISGEDMGFVSSENFFLSSKNVISKKLPRAKIEGDLATIYIGESLVSGNITIPKRNLLLDFLNLNAKENNFENIYVETFAILDDPDLGFEYDWTKSSYPMPSELIEEMKTRLLSKEFNIILQTNPDNITDGNNNSATRRAPVQEQ